MVRKVAKPKPKQARRGSGGCSVGRDECGRRSDGCVWIKGRRCYSLKRDTYKQYVVPEEGEDVAPAVPGEAVSVTEQAGGSGRAEGPAARPNPASDRVLLVTGGDVAEWAVHDGTGRCMERGGRTSGSLLLETADWPAGTYHWTAVGASGAPLRIRFVVL